MNTDFYLFFQFFPDCAATWIVQTTNSFWSITIKIFLASSMKKREKKAEAVSWDSVCLCVFSINGFFLKGLICSVDPTVCSGSGIFKQGSCATRCETKSPDRRSHVWLLPLFRTFLNGTGSGCALISQRCVLWGLSMTPSVWRHNKSQITSISFAFQQKRVLVLEIFS